MKDGVSDMQRVLKIAQGPGRFTLRWVAELTGIPEASVSAHLRHLRKVEYGGYRVTKQRDKGSKTWLYRIHDRDFDIWDKHVAQDHNIKR